jgi:hypothetical protein
MPVDPVDPYIIPAPPPEQVTIEGSTSETEPPPETSTVSEDGKGENVDTFA